MPLLIKQRRKGSVKKDDVGFGGFIRPRNEYVAVPAEPEFVNSLMSPGIDSQPGGIVSSESIPGLLKRLQIRIRALLIGGPLWCYLRLLHLRYSNDKRNRYFDNTVYNNMNLGVVHTCSDKKIALYMRKRYKNFSAITILLIYLSLLYSIHIYISRLRLCNIHKKDICNR